MQFVPFHEYFPDIAEKETRELVVNSQSGTLSGGYGLLEMYCKDPECDCRRVMFNIISERERKFVAIINFGWESIKFYEEWLGEKDDIILKEIKGPSLNSASRQSQYAAELLQLVQDVVLKDKSYVDRLKRHYKIFKDKMKEEKQQYEKEINSNVGYKPGRNDACSCGSGKKYKRCCGAK
jgi:hypothetical protein